MKKNIGVNQGRLGNISLSFDFDKGQLVIEVIENMYMDATVAGKHDDGTTDNAPGWKPLRTWIAHIPMRILK